MTYERLREVAPAVADALVGERARQNDTLAMIATETHVSEAVMAAQSSELTNKYAEGYPGGRYYGGCAYTDASNASPSGARRSSGPSTTPTYSPIRARKPT